MLLHAALGHFGVVMIMMMMVGNGLVAVCSDYHSIRIPALHHHARHRRIDSTSCHPVDRWRSGTNFSYLPPPLSSWRLNFSSGAKFLLWCLLKVGTYWTQLCKLYVSVYVWRMTILVGHQVLQGDLARTVQSVLFVSAINTLVQTFLGTRLPVIMGNSFYFLAMTLSIVQRAGIADYPDPHEVPNPIFLTPPRKTGRVIA